MSHLQIGAWFIPHPATMITDYLLSLAALTFAVLLTLSMRSNRKTVVLWVFGFITAAAGAATGGTYHGFERYFSPDVSRSLWSVTLTMIGATAGFFLSAGFVDAPPRHPQRKRWLRAGAAVSVSGLLVQLSGAEIHPDFNHADLYHCIQIAGFCLFYRGLKPAEISEFGIRN